MTRDEAIEIDFELSCKCPTWQDQTLEFIRAAAVTQIDSYIALGMLKVDESKSVEAKLELAKKALEEMVSAFKPFSLKPMGAPSSQMRIDQDRQIAAHNHACAALAEIAK